MSKCTSCAVKWAFADGLCRACAAGGGDEAVAKPVEAGGGDKAVALKRRGFQGTLELPAEPKSPKRGDGTSSSGLTPRAGKLAIGSTPRETCTACGGTVYQAERSIVRSRIYHTTCLKCGDCSKKLQPGSVEMDAEGKIFCSVHFQQRKMAGTLDLAAGGRVREMEATGASNVVRSDMGDRHEEQKAAGQSATSSAFGDRRWQQAAKKDACHKCGKTVYIAEKMEAEWRRKGSKNVQLYHKGCFRCVDCNAVLRAGQYEICPTCDDPPSADLLCRAHYGERKLAGRVPE